MVDCSARSLPVCRLGLLDAVRSDVMPFSVRARLSDFVMRLCFYSPELRVRKFNDALKWHSLQEKEAFKRQNISMWGFFFCPLMAAVPQSSILSPREIWAQTLCNRVYRQSQRHFNWSPRYLICREGTLEGLQPKRAHSIIEPAKDHVNGLVLMQTWRRGWQTSKSLAWRRVEEGEEGSEVQDVLWKGMKRMREFLQSKVMFRRRRRKRRRRRADRSVNTVLESNLKRFMTLAVIQ